MRLSKRSEYALRALVAIARVPAGRLLQIQEISAAENIPVKFLEQILLGLRHSGVLSSKRGVRGGYSFARRPEKITVGEIVRLMDGPIAPVPCASPNPSEECSCPDPRRCAVRLFMREVRDDLSRLLDGRSIADIAELGAGQDALEFVI